MQMEIFISEWKVRISENKQKTIAGTYQVKMGEMVVSESQFNDGFNTTDIVIPPEILTKIANIDDEIKQAIIKNFTA